MSENDSLMEECRAVAYRAGEIHKWLTPVMREEPLAKRAYSFKDRVKTADDVRNKVLAHRNDPKRNRRDYAPSEVTDISGFRIVMLFNAEVPQALDELLSYVKTSPSKGRGCVTGIREIEFHTSRRLDDPLSIYAEVKRVVETNGYELEPPSASASSYSSVHVLLDCKSGSEEYCTEIQLRSVFEEAWGEISHRLKYAPTKIARAKGPSETAEDSMPADFWLHLDALKSLTDGCAQYADLINRQIPRSGPAERVTTPLDPTEKSLAEFKRYSEPLLGLVKKAYGLRNKAAPSAINVKRGPPPAFFEAAKAFDAAIEAFPKSEGKEDLRLLDVLREELAYCGMFSADAELMARAEKTYRELCETRPERVSVWLRLGQLRRDAGDYAEAKSLMDQGLKVLPQPIPKDDATRQPNWLLRRDLAYVCWRLVDRDPARADAEALLGEAIGHSEKSLKYTRTEGQLLNTLQNLLYFLYALWDRSTADQKVALAARGKAVLAELKPHLKFDKWGLEEIDSIMRGEVAFGEPELAKTAARLIFSKLAERVATVRRERNLSHTLAFESLSPDERDMFLFAQEILGTER